MFIIALFTIAKTWKHPNCPSANGWGKRMCPLSPPPTHWNIMCSESA